MSTPIPSLGNKTPEQLKVAELREELKKRGSNFKGLKKDLVERLDEILRQEAADAEDQLKKSSPDVSNDEEEASTPPAAVEVTVELTHEDNAAVTPQELKPGFVELELIESLPEETDLSSKGKEGEIGKTEESVVERELASKSVTDAAELSLPEDTQPDFECDEESGLEPEHLPAVVVFDEGRLSKGEAQMEYEEVGDEKFDSGESVEAEDKVSSEYVGGVEAELENLPDVELQIQSEQGRPAYCSGPASSTDAVIIETSEADDIPTENTFVSEEPRRASFGDRDAAEEEGSVVEETGAEPTELITIETLETVSVVTETTVVTTEMIVVNKVEAEHEEGSFTHRSIESGTFVERKDKEEGVEEQQRSGVEGLEVEQDGKGKDSKPMDIDSDTFTGLKRKDGDESRHQEPTKRQRRWNSEKSARASADVKAPPIVITTDTFKEVIAPEVLENAQSSVAQSPSTTASSTPKASVPVAKASASTSCDKPAPSRPALLRAEIAGNGEVDKKRQVPPPSRTPTVALKVDRFVRPFTIKAVKELLEQTGTVKEMWMDQIKTHCYVTYSSVEEAIATRNALYYLQWPVAGGKLLIAEFVEPEEVKLHVDGLTDKPAATPVTTPRGLANSSTQVVSPVGLAPLVVPVPTAALPPPPPLPPPPRERPALTPRKEQEPPIPTLDDLFKKTRTKPQVYFLPLTEEQVAAKLRNKQPLSKVPMKA